MNDNKQSITFVHSAMLMGGIERSLLEMIRLLHQQHFEISLCLFWKGGELEKEIPNYVRTYYLRPESLSEIIKRTDWFSLVKGLYYRLLIHLDRDKKRKSVYTSNLCGIPDEVKDSILICYTHVIMPFRWTAQQKNVRKYVFVHLFPFDNQTNYYFEKCFENYRKIFCVSDSVKKYICKTHPKHKEKTLVIHNPVDSKRIKELSDLPLPYEIKKPALVSVGRLDRIKGFEIIPAVMRKLIDDGYCAYWYIVGEGPERGKLEQLIQERNVENNVFLVGNMNNPYPWMKSASIYIQPSIHEGYGLTVYEAKILKKPIIASNIPPFMEQICSQKNGILSNTDCTCFTNEIERLLDHPEIGQSFCEALGEECTENEDMNRLIQILNED